MALKKKNPEEATVEKPKIIKKADTQTKSIKEELEESATQQKKMPKIIKEETDDLIEETKEREQIAKAKERKKSYRTVIITARHDVDRHDSHFVFNGVVIPLGVPVKADATAIKMIKQMKTYKRTAGTITPYQYAQENGITMEEAERILNVSGGDTVLSESQISWESKYIIEVID